MPDDEDDAPPVRHNEWNLSLLGKLLLKCGYDIRQPADQKEFISDILYLRGLRTKEIARKAQFQWFYRAAVVAILGGVVSAVFLWAQNVFPHIGGK